MSCGAGSPVLRLFGASKWRCVEQRTLRYTLWRDDSMAGLEVGQPYAVGRTNWPEGAEYDYCGGQHELRLFLRSPKARETEAVRRGKYQFALVSGPSVFFLMYRFGKAIKWSHAPCSWQLASGERQPAAPAAMQAAMQALLRAVLVDAQTGLVRALRTVTLPPGFECDLSNALRTQFPLASRADYDAALADMNRFCPTSRRLLERAVACTGPTPREKLVHRVRLREHRINMLLDLIYCFMNRSYDDQTIRCAEEVLSTVEPELYAEGFMRVDRSFEVPHE
jgi:hypothetical protein